MAVFNRRTFLRFVAPALVGAVISLSTLTFTMATPAAAGFPAFMQAVAETASNDEALATFYRERDYAPIWTGPDDANRRRAFLQALESAADHGLPVGRYGRLDMLRDFAAAASARERGRVEVETSRRFLQFARDLHSGILTPRHVLENLDITPPRADQLERLRAFAAADPDQFLRALAPTTPHYIGLLKEKIALERVIDRGGWGPTLRSGKLEPGDTGPSVIALRNRLIRMGYMRATAAASYNADLQEAVQLFQIDHGLESDGVAGTSTIAAVNIPARERLGQVVVGLERARWLNMPLGKRHILVNQADFRAFIYDDGKVTFSTRVVVGQARPDLRTPEFSDVMEHMIVNPTWNVPRSIAIKEYLPQLQADPYAAAQLNVLDIYGQIVDRSMVDFNAYDGSTFPFDLKQPPSLGNALGLVKFMFPNKHNVYLHDTPSKSLFGRVSRAFSHGCVRVQDPFDLAYALLARQTDDPQGLFQSTLATGQETQINLAEPVPIHLTYRTVWIDNKGRVNYRNDMYGRDAVILGALRNVGVELKANPS